MPDSDKNIGWGLIVFGLILLPLSPIVVKFRWLEPKGGNRWARGLLWALVVPGEITALSLIYIGIRPRLVGAPVVSPIDEFIRIVVNQIIVAIILVVLVVLSIILRILQPTYPFAPPQAPSDQTYEHWREHGQKPQRK
jgi:hypothetical protein